MKPWLKKLLLILGAGVLLVAAFVGGVMIYSATYSIPEQAASIENNTGLVQASGRSLYDAQGNALHLKGINAGQILLQGHQFCFIAVANHAQGSGEVQTEQLHETVGADFVVFIPNGDGKGSGGGNGYEILNILNASKSDRKFQHKTLPPNCTKLHFSCIMRNTVQTGPFFAKM